MNAQTSQAVPNPGTLYVEVRLKDSAAHGFREEEIRAGITAWIRRNHTEVRVGTVLYPAHTASPLANAVERVDITGHSKSKQFPDETFHPLGENELEILVYFLFSDDDGRSESGQDSGDEADKATCLQFDALKLPNRAFDGLWESLIFEDPIGELTLRVLTRAVQKQRDWRTSSWQNTVLFHGPPGSGKSTLALALAQRLSIRLSNVFSVTKLVQINAHMLFSHLFGETSKRIGQLFESISDMALDECQLTAVVFDEVETVAGSREKAGQKNEPGESIKATNELLRGLDRFRRHSNVVFVFTSNLIGSLDSAFVDRCCVEEEVNAPATECAFDILRMEINELIAHDLIVFETMIYGGSGASCSDTSSARLQVPRACSPLESSPDKSPALIPCRQWANIHWPSKAMTAVSELYRVAKLAKGLSGRKLKGLVAQAQYKYLVDEPGDLRDLLVALEAVIRKKTRRSAMCLEEDRATTQHSQARMDEAVDMAKFLSDLEADNGEGDGEGEVGSASG